MIFYLTMTTNEWNEAAARDTSGVTYGMFTTSLLEDVYRVMDGDMNLRYTNFNVSRSDISGGHNWTLEKSLIDEEDDTWSYKITKQEGDDTSSRYGISFSTKNPKTPSYINWNNTRYNGRNYFRILGGDDSDRRIGPTSLNTLMTERITYAVIVTDELISISSLSRQYTYNTYFTRLGFTDSFVLSIVKLKQIPSIRKTLKANAATFFTMDYSVTGYPIIYVMGELTISNLIRNDILAECRLISEIDPLRLPRKVHELPLDYERKIKPNTFTLSVDVDHDAIFIPEEIGTLDFGEIVVTTTYSLSSPNGIPSILMDGFKYTTLPLLFGGTYDNEQPYTGFVNAITLCIKQ